MRPPSSRFAVLFVLSAGAFLVSCVGLQQYHTDPEECRGDPATECARAYIEDHDAYMLGFIELDDLGWAWERRQGEVLLGAIQREVDRGDVLMVVFAHGWQHNASACDNNVACFRETLLQLHLTERAMARGRRTERRIIGVYVGWRGRSASGRILSNTTFYGRKNTAHKVGSGAVTELLVRLKEVRAQTHERRPGSSTRLVIVGHSFGGALVFSATSQLMMERLAIADARARAAARSEEVRGLGDLVVLVNPAFEAARYQPLHETLIAEDQYSPNQKPVMAVVTSRADGATRVAFPLGRFFSTVKDTYRSDRRAEQKKSNKTAVGHYEPFRTHFLDANEDTPPPQPRRRNAPDCGCPYELSEGEISVARSDEIRGTLEGLQRQRRESSSTLMSFPSADLRHDKHPPLIPIQMISVDPKIIQSHNDIYQPAFIDFLRYYIMLAAEPLDEEGG